MDLAIFLLPIGFLSGYLVISWRYKKELQLRFKWMKEKLKDGKWKMPVAFIFILNLATMISRMVFSMVPRDFLLGPFLYAMYIPFLFTIFFFKFFYEIIGGKREWKL